MYPRGQVFARDTRLKFDPSLGIDIFIAGHSARIAGQELLGSSAESVGKLIAKAALPAFSNIE